MMSHTNGGVAHAMHTGLMILAVFAGVVVLMMCILFIMKKTMTQTFMVKQITIDFTTASPINTEQLTGQNKTVFEILHSGNTINCLQAQLLGITALNSRISDLRHKAKITIYDRYINTAGSKIK